MGVLNLSHDEKEALKGIDEDQLDDLVEQAIRHEQMGDLYRLPLRRCGSHVGSELGSFQRALTNHRAAKSAKKRADTGEALERAGRDLTFAVSTMKGRVQKEETDGQFFHVDDEISPPYRLSDRLSVCVRFRWRRTVEDQWTSGSITISHRAVRDPDYTLPTPKRKPSKAQEEQDRQAWLFETWNYLMRGALFSVRDYFRDGGDGSTIPKEFQANPSSHGGGLDNFSTDFWRKR